MNNIPPIKYWPTFVDAAILRNEDNRLPFFCLAMNWHSTKVNFEPEEGEILEKDLVEMRPYFYGLN